MVLPGCEPPVGSWTVASTLTVGATAMAFKLASTLLLTVAKPIAAPTPAFLPKPAPSKNICALLALVAPTSISLAVTWPPAICAVTPSLPPSSTVLTL